MNLFRDVHMKRAIRAAAILLVVLAGFILLSCSILRDQTAKAYLARDAALFGRLITQYPGAEKDIAPLFIQETGTEDMEKGYAALQKYGMDKNLPAGSLPVYNEASEGFLLYPVIIASALFIVATAILLYLLARILRKVDRAGRYAEAALAGEPGDLDTVGEGAVSRLNTSLNQLSNRLKAGIAGAKKDKEYLKDFVSDISHQLKTPLTTLMIYNELLTKKADTDAEKELLEKSGEQLVRMERLIKSLLTAARLEAGAVVFKTVAADMGQTLRSAAAQLEALCEGKGVSIDVQAIEAIYPHDILWLKEAFINIIKNALEHSKAGGTVHIRMENTAVFVKIYIRDEGAGMEPERLKTIFKRFSRQSSEASPEKVGIGLSLSKQIITLMGGDIKAESIVGKGTTFAITFLKV